MMRLRSCIHLIPIVLALAGTAAPANALVDQLIKWVENIYSSSKTRVVVIGINEYSRAPSLDYAVNDANAMIELFEALGYDIRSRLLRAEPSSTTHITKTKIRTTVRRVLQEAKVQDRVIIFYAGHGIEVEDRFDPKIKDAYLLPSDYDPADPTGTGFAFRDLVRLAREQGVEAKHILFILDACYAADALNFQSGREVPVKADEPYIKHLVASSGVVAITAGDKGQPVREAGGHGIFTKLLVRGLAGDADTDANGLVHFEELAQWLRPLVFAESRSFKQTVKNGKLAPGAGEPVFVVPSDDIRRNILGTLVADEVKANLIQRCNTEKRGRDCPYLARGTAPVASASPASNQMPDDERVWRVIQNSNNARDFDLFVEKYPDSVFAPFARNRLEETRKETAGEMQAAAAVETQVAAVVPAPAPAVPSLVEEIVGVYPQPKSVFRDRLKDGRDCPYCPEMVVIPEGQFMMGSPRDEQGRGDREDPVHRVTIRKPFAVGKYEIMFREWDACVADGGCNGYRPDDAGWGRDNRPAIDVSWDDTQAYLDWLSRESGAEYRLLSEAEWEYAARADTTAARYWGNDPAGACGFANVHDRTSKSVNKFSWTHHECTDGHAQTAPAGSFQPNSFGLYDVLGNVWEWVEDCWNDSYSGAPIDGSAWTRGECEKRVQRGGSWGYTPRSVRSADRNWLRAGNRNGGSGFRVARTLPEWAYIVNQ